MFDCTIEESNGGLINVAMDVGNLIGFQTSPPLNLPGSCDESLDDGEPDTATVTCFCVDPASPDFDPSLAVTASDQAMFDCQTPLLNLAKDCAPPDENGVDHIAITVSNDGSADLIHCTVTDEYYDSAACGAPGAGTSVPLASGGSFNLASGGGSQVFTGAISVLQESCNRAAVTCAIADENGQPAIHPNTGQPRSISRADEDLCEPPEGCLTRGPGFWATHPHIAEGFLPLVNCGIEIHNTRAGAAGSSSEDLCWSGRDFKGADTSPSQLQLIRQCMAAHLNIAASPSGGRECDEAYPGIREIVHSCCEEICVSGPTGGEIAASECIGMLDSFNSLDDTLNAYGSFINPGPAQPDECREANGNGYVNPDRNLGPRR